MNKTVQSAGSPFVAPGAPDVLAVQNVIDGRLVVGQRKRAGRRSEGTGVERVGAVGRAPAVADRRREDVERFAVGEVVFRVAVVADPRDFERRSERQHAVVADRPPELGAQEVVLLRLVVVGVARFAVRDVVGNLERVVAVDEGDVCKVVPAGGEREPRELTDRASIVMR